MLCQATLYPSYALYLVYSATLSDRHSTFTMVVSVHRVCWVYSVAGHSVCDVHVQCLRAIQQWPFQHLWPAWAVNSPSGSTGTVLCPSLSPRSIAWEYSITAPLSQFKTQFTRGKICWSLRIITLCNVFVNKVEDTLWREIIHHGTSIQSNFKQK